MKTQEKNVSLAGYNHTKTETMETVMNIFLPQDNHSYTICFLGSRSSTIFEKKDNAQAPITIKEVEEIVEAIFDEFLASKSLKNLKIITNGATGGGIPEIVVKKFNKIRRDKEVDLKEKNKQIQLIAITSFQGRVVQTEGDSLKDVGELVRKNKVLSGENDYYIKVKDEISQMISLAECIVFLPGGKKTLEQLRYTCDYFSQLTDKELAKYGLLYHSFWKEKETKEAFSTSNSKKVGMKLYEYIIGKRKNIISFNQYEEKNINEILDITKLKEEIVNRYFTRPLFGKEERENAILGIDFTYLISNISEKKIHKELYCRKEYKEISQEWRDCLFVMNEAEEYRVIVLPESPLQYTLGSLEYETFSPDYGDSYRWFDDFVEILRKKAYGQTLVWRSSRIKSLEIEGEDRIEFSIVLLFNCLIPKQIIEDLGNLLDKYIHKKVSGYLSTIEKKLKEREEKLYQRSIQHAISQVFVRNMSHNIISHVMVNLQDKEAIENLEKIITKGNYTGINLTKEEAKNILSKEYQLAILNKYNSNRCLYLNEATYSVSKFVENMNVYNDLFRRLDENRVFLNLISAVDSFKYRFSFLYQGEKLTKENDIAVMIPGGALGQQAFYNIIENIIRNTAKHSGNREKEQVTFTVNFSEYDKKIDTENIANVAEILKWPSDKIEKIHQKDRDYWFFKKDRDYWSRILELPKKYYQVEIYDNIDIGDHAYKVVEDLNTKILLKVIEGDSLRSHSLGILEMKASAAFLRQIDITQLDPYTVPEGGEADFIPFITAFVHQEGDRKSVGYRFFIKKVEKYLVICPKEYALLEDEYKDKISKWKNIGIELLSTERFLKDIEASNTFNHEFVLLLTQKAKEELGCIGDFFYLNHRDKQQSQSIKERIPELSLLSERLLYLKDDFFRDKIVEEAIQVEKQLFSIVWEQWEGKKEKGDHIYIEINSNSIAQTDIEFNYDQCRQVIFHDHLYKIEEWTKITKRIENEKLIAMEPLSSAAQRKLPYFNTSGGKLDDYVIGLIHDPALTPFCIPQQLAEAYFNNVILIDERIQRFAYTPYLVGNNEVLLNKEIFDRIKVLIPKKEEIDLDKECFSLEEVEKMESYISQHILEAEFLVIHYGFFERIYGKENHNQRLNEKLEDWAKKIRTIVVTGRGQHTLEGLPQAVLYLNLSSLLDAFKDNRNKYTINYILNQTRK